VQQERYAAVKAIADRFKCVCVLKGAGTLVSDGSIVYVCDRGHPGMATAGTGDVLSGVIGGLLAQGLSPLAAACCGAWLHAVAGEQAAAGFGNGLVASDLIDCLAPTLMRALA
jgi:NAD(P)H-hydrate epimerase